MFTIFGNKGRHLLIRVTGGPKFTNFGRSQNVRGNFLTLGMLQNPLPVEQNRVRNPAMVLVE